MASFRASFLASSGLTLPEIYAEPVLETVFVSWPAIFKKLNNTIRLYTRFMCFILTNVKQLLRFFQKTHPHKKSKTYKTKKIKLSILEASHRIANAIIIVISVNIIISEEQVAAPAGIGIEL